MARKQYGMVIDLHRCVGCAGCDIACKSENNVPDGFSWSNHIIETAGRFPDVRYRYIPTLCNHCTDAPCVAACPTTAMHKSEDGITLHATERCIGCRACQVACPYGVIWFNHEEPHAGLREDEAAAIPGGTFTGAEVVAQTGSALPHANPARTAADDGLRPRGVVEKCDFCAHRVRDGEQPWCVESCPAGARLFGDLNDPSSAPRRALAKHAPRVLQPEMGTRPNVLYIRDY